MTGYINVSTGRTVNLSIEAGVDRTPKLGVVVELTLSSHTVIIAKALSCPLETTT